MTRIRFAVPESAHVKLMVYDMLGRQVCLLVDGERAAGTHEAAFDTAMLPSGTYVAGGFPVLDCLGRVASDFGCDRGINIEKVGDYLGKFARASGRILQLSYEPRAELPPPL